jgi:RNA binding exosome subunit
MSENTVEARDAVIRKAVVETLSPAKIREVRVRESEDHYGDPIYRVDIVLGSDDEELDTKKTILLWEAVMEALEKEGYEVRVPIFTFMTPSEAEDAAA